MLKYEPIGKTIPSPAEERERYIAALEKKVCQLGATCLSLIVIVIVLAVLKERKEGLHMWYRCVKCGCRLDPGEGRLCEECKETEKEGGNRDGQSEEGRDSNGSDLR